MSESTPSLARRLLPLVIGVAFLLLTVIALFQVLAFRAQLRSREIARLESELRTASASIEERLLTELGGWLADVEAEPDRAHKFQERWRRVEPWFDSVYVWEKERDRPEDRGEDVPAVHFLYPVSAVQDAPLTDACLDAAEAGRSTLEVHEVAGLYVSGCRTASLPVRVYAATEAATLLSQASDPEEALAILDASGVSHDRDLTLTEGIARGIAPWRIVNLRLLSAELKLQLGRGDEGLQDDYGLGLEITALDAPDAEPLLGRVRHPILKELRSNDHRADADRLEVLLSRAERRVQAWTEIRDKILQPARNGQVSEGTRFIYDQYSATPWLLFYGWSPNGRLGVALELEQSAVLDEILASEPLRGLKPWLTVTDAGGEWVAGVRRGGPVVISVPFTRTLAHLRLGLHQEAIERDLADLQFQWVTPLSVVAFCAVLGGIALFVQARASRQQAALLGRQREFTTRVTHELKTPLAGIRVMAENLETGAWSDPSQVRAAAGRILAETDRLTGRVDEVLAVARTRSIPNPEPVDPEEALLVAIDDWGPRLEQAGVRLLADLNPTDAVRGDAGALTDAVACLLDNALKYRREDRPDPKVWLVLSQSGKWVEIAVTDNGIGVPAKMRGAIFDRFVRVEGPNRGTAGGHGLGLAQVREIAEAHGGTVACSEGVEGGARFTLRLPAVR
jgi:signal transduction histidine kinase